MFACQLTDALQLRRFTAFDAPRQIRALRVHREDNSAGMSCLNYNFGCSLLKLSFQRDGQWNERPA